MTPYNGLTEEEWNVVRLALSKLQITGAEAPLMVNLLQKVNMEIELLKIPPKVEETPQKKSKTTK